MTIKDLINRKNSDKEMRTVIPVVNIQEKREEIILNTEMPGVEKDQISVEVHEDQLTLTGKRVLDAPKGYTPIVHERIPVEYKRVFSLGNQINHDAVSAQYEDGILNVRLKKTEAAQPRKITIT